VPAHGGEPFVRTLHGRVIGVQDLGTDAFIEVDLGVRDALVLARCRPPVRFRRGDPIELAVRPGRMKLFDPETSLAVS